MSSSIKQHPQLQEPEIVLTNIKPAIEPPEFPDYLRCLLDAAEFKFDNAGKITALPDTGCMSLNERKEYVLRAASMMRLQAKKNGWNTAIYTKDRVKAITGAFITMASCGIPVASVAALTAPSYSFSTQFENPLAKAFVISTGMTAGLCAAILSSPVTLYAAVSGLKMMSEPSIDAAQEIMLLALDNVYQGKFTGEQRQSLESNVQPYSSRHEERHEAMQLHSSSAREAESFMSRVTLEMQAILGEGTVSCGKSDGDKTGIRTYSSEQLLSMRIQQMDELIARAKEERAEKNIDLTKVYMPLNISAPLNLLLFAASLQMGVSLSMNASSSPWIQGACFLPSTVFSMMATYYAAGFVMQKKYEKKIDGMLDGLREYGVSIAKIKAQQTTPEEAARQHFQGFSKEPQGWGRG